MTSSLQPAAIATYWDAVDRELADCTAAPYLVPSARRSTPFADAYDLRLTSIGPYRIFAYYSVPHGDGPFPVLYHTPRYGSVNNPPGWEERERFIILTLMHRGQRLADQPFAAEYPGLLTLGIDDPSTYIYRDIVADCLRGFEFLLSRPEVDPNRIGVVGDDLALLVAARRPEVAALHLSGLMFYRALEARPYITDYPREEFNDYLRTYPERADAVAQTLAYFDGRNHAARVKAASIVSVDEESPVDSAAWLAPLTATLGGEVEIDKLTYEDGADRDRVDAWLSSRLGVEPRPRVWSISA